MILSVGQLICLFPEALPGTWWERESEMQPSVGGLLGPWPPPWSELRSEAPSLCASHQGSP